MGEADEIKRDHIIGPALRDLRHIMDGSRRVRR
jgi:hypothetical protein